MKIVSNILFLIGLAYLIFILSSCHHYQHINQTLEIGKHGKWIIKNDTTNRITIVNYNQGKKHGKYLVYHSNGRVSITGFYNKDKRHRVWKTYLADGTLSSVIKYQNEKVKRVKIYNHSW